MEGLTPPMIGRLLSEPRSRVERWLTQYAHELPAPARVGHYRLFPEAVVDLLKEIRAREERCGAGGRR